MIPFKVGETVWRKYTYDFSFYDSYVVVKINHLDLERFLINKTSKNEVAVTERRDCYQEDYISYGDPVYEI